MRIPLPAPHLPPSQCRTGHQVLVQIIKMHSRRRPGPGAGSADHAHPATSSRPGQLPPLMSWLTAAARRRRHQHHSAGRPATRQAQQQDLQPGRRRLHFPHQLPPRRVRRAASSPSSGLVSPRAGSGSSPSTTSQPGLPVRHDRERRRPRPQARPREGFQVPSARRQEGRQEQRRLRLDRRTVHGHPAPRSMQQPRIRARCCLPRGRPPSRARRGGGAEQAQRRHRLRVRFPGLHAQLHAAPAASAWPAAAPSR